MSKKVNKTAFSYGGEKLRLTKNKTKGAVQYVPGAQPAKARKRSGESSEKIEEFELVSAKRGIGEKLDKLRALPEVSVGTHVWSVDDDDENPFIPTGNLYVEFLADADFESQQALLEGLFLNIKEVVGTAAYRVCTTPQSPNPVKCAVQLQKSKIVRTAEPEFAAKPAERAFSLPAGQYFSTQWHLENTGQQIPIIDIQNAVFGQHQFKPGADAKIKAAWQHLQNLGASSIKIAVIDTGFATDHPQLKGNGTKIRNPFNAAKRSADVSPYVRKPDGTWIAYSHGTSCAAVLAGAPDAQGITGAAPNARIIPIKLDVLTDEAIKAAFEHALLNGADIISCSLGYPKAVPLSTYVSNYISKVAREGRGGKGIPIFIAAGNANPASNNQPRQISDFGAHPDVICITASNSLDKRASYSFYGPNAHNCAPTNGDDGVGITTATVTLSADGRNAKLGYTSSFGGTSSAAPLTAGLCALLLSANPDLTVAAIRQILRQTADKIGSAADYDANGHSNYLGYGRVNALKAVQAATAMRSANTGGSGTGEAQRGTVISATLKVRSGPSTTYAVVSELKKGEEVYLLEKTGAWWRIGNDAYVSGDYIQVQAPARKGKVISSTLNVRNGPTVNNAKVAELKLNALVTILESTTDGWYRIGQGQWVLGKYVQII